MTTDAAKRGKVAIVGCGLIGSSWAALFLSGGYEVALYDVSEKQLRNAMESIKKNLDKLDETGLQRGPLNATQALANVTSTTDLKVAMKDAIYVQESTIETVEFHQKIFGEMDELAGPETIMGSSTSTIPASQFTEGLKNRERCLVVHPVNPPLYLPLTELVPAPWTSPSTVDKVHSLMASIGQDPIRLNREIPGFALNRLQFALVAEAWRLVADDVVSVDDLDKVMRSGLGPRYAFEGPHATLHLNANGTRDFWKKYAPIFRTVTKDFGPNPTFDDPAVIDKLATTLDARMPVEHIKEYHHEREKNLAKLAKLKRGDYAKGSCTIM